MTIQERLAQIEEQIRTAGNIPGETKAELQKLLESLRSEIATLPTTHEDQARSIANFAEASAHEATRPAVKPKQLEAALKGLTAPVTEFETSHPDLAAVLNRLAAILANMGM